MLSRGGTGHWDILGGGAQASKGSRFCPGVFYVRCPQREEWGRRRGLLTLGPAGDSTSWSPGDEVGVVIKALCDCFRDITKNRDIYGALCLISPSEQLRWRDN